jgi:hypothetical protein
MDFKEFLRKLIDVQFHTELDRSQQNRLGQSIVNYSEYKKELGILPEVYEEICALYHTVCCTSPMSLVNHVGLLDVEFNYEVLQVTRQLDVLVNEELKKGSTRVDICCVTRDSKVIKEVVTRFREVGYTVENGREIVLYPVLHDGELATNE